MPDSTAPQTRAESPALEVVRGSLTVGSPAPPIASLKWLAGDLFDPAQCGEPLVIEFWSTWSGEHLGEIDRLSLAFPTVRFLSVAVGDLEENVRAFVRQFDSSPRHGIAIETEGSGQEPGENRPGPLTRDWLEAFGEHGLPITFLVDGTKRVRWIGHASELARVLPQLQAGTLTTDPLGHRRRQTLMALEIDPDTSVDESAFEPLFSIQPPRHAIEGLKWLAPPAAKPVPPTPQANVPKQGGILGRVFGRSKTAAPQADTPDQASPRLERTGPPRTGQALALVLADVIMDRSLEPGWNVLNVPELNDLPGEHPEVEFAVAVRTHEPLETLFDAEYADSLSRWMGEIGWRLGAEIARPPATAPTPGESVAASGLFDFFADRLHLLALPAAVLIDPSGKLLWAGSPLRLAQAVQAWKSQELTPAMACADLIYWFRLLASNSANERLAGVAGSQPGGSAGWQGFPADTFESDRWAEIIDQLKEQLPWRSHLWSVFEFSLATRERRKSGSSTAAAQEIVAHFEALSDRFATEFASMEPDRLADYDYDPLDAWRMTILTAVDDLGLLREGVEPLDGAELFAIEAHPLTQAVVESAHRLNQALGTVPPDSVFLPSVWPVLMLRLGHKAEAKKGLEAEERRFEAFASALQSMGGQEAVVRSLGGEPESYRSMLRGLKALCDGSS